MMGTTLSGPVGRTGTFFVRLPPGLLRILTGRKLFTTTFFMSTDTPGGATLPEEILQHGLVTLEGGQSGFLGEDLGLGLPFVGGFTLAGPNDLFTPGGLTLNLKDLTFLTGLAGAENFVFVIFTVNDNCSGTVELTVGGLLSVVEPLMLLLIQSVGVFLKTLVFFKLLFFIGAAVYEIELVNFEENLVGGLLSGETAPEGGPAARVFSTLAGG